jgi:hypothetical protein
MPIKTLSKSKEKIETIKVEPHIDLLKELQELLNDKEIYEKW